VRTARKGGLNKNTWASNITSCNRNSQWWVNPKVPETIREAETRKSPMFPATTRKGISGAIQEWITPPLSRTGKSVRFGEIQQRLEPDNCPAMCEDQRPDFRWLEPGGQGLQRRMVLLLAF